MARTFVIELLDIPYHARPSLQSMDLGATARRIIALRKGGGGNRNYDLNVAQISDMVTGLAELERLKAQFDRIENEAWRSQTVDVCKRLYSVFGTSRSIWHPANRKPRELYDRTLFKHAIRGVWGHDGQAMATLINLRKTQVLNGFVQAFLARGLHEFYLRDEPNLHGFKIIDLGADPKSDARATRTYTSADIVPMTLEQFEDILRQYMTAVEMAGLSSRPKTGESIADMFRPYR